MHRWSPHPIMSEYETLSLIVSLISALIAVWAIIVSRRTANEQRQVAQHAHLLEVRNLAATHHGKYSELLFAVRSDIQETKDHVANSSRDAFGELCDLFDRFGDSEGGRPTRHLFHEICESIYEAFRPQLTWQTGLNLLHRYQVFRHVEDEIQVSPADREELEAEAAREALDLRREYKRDPNRALERLVMSSSRFRLSVLALQDRIDAESGNRLLQAALPPLIKYVQVHESVVGQFRQAHETLANALKRNELEEFPLRGSGGLYAAYERELAKLNALVELRPYGVEGMQGIRLHAPISTLIYMGALLYTAQMCWEWGE